MRTPTPLLFRRAALLSLGLLAAGAQATIVVHDTPFAIPFDSAGTGMYLNVATGAFGPDPDAPALAGVDFHLWLNTGPLSGLLFAANSLQPTNAWVGSNQIGPFSFDPGETIDASQGFTVRNGVSGAFRQDRTGYLGVRFFNEATSATNYGWLEITTLPGTNAATFTATVDRWAYEDSGAGIVTGAVPEPASLAALGLGGLALLRRRRR